MRSELEKQNQSIGEPRELLKEMLAHYSGDVRRYLCSFVSSDVADDLLQEVFLCAIKYADRYREQGKLRAFLLKIASNKVKERYRKYSREFLLSETQWELNQPEFEARAIDLLAIKESTAKLIPMLRRLTSSQRQVLVLRYFCEFGFDKIARLLDCPPNTVHSHCRRGLANLRKLMPDSENNESQDWRRQRGS